MRAVWLILWFAIDVALKFGVGIVLALVVWLPFGLLGGFAVWPWLVGGVVLGLAINGLTELSDIFGLRKLLHLDDRLGPGSRAVKRHSAKSGESTP